MMSGGAWTHQAVPRDTWDRMNTGASGTIQDILEAILIDCYTTKARQQPKMMRIP